MSTQQLESFIADAPPGELNAVIEDLDLITGFDCSKKLSKEIAQYHMEQLQVVSLNGRNALVSKYNCIEQESQGVAKFYDSVQELEFEYENKSPTATAGQPKQVSQAIQELNAKLKVYVSQHFPSHCAYGAYEQEDGSTVIVIVDNKYSPSNFWSGRWRSIYTIAPGSSSAQAEIYLDMHYYEDGNVRVKGANAFEIPVSNVGDIVTQISKAETLYQTNVNRTFVGLNEGQFKSLRRQLPVTRSKMMWGKAIGNYRLGKDLARE